MDKRLRRLSAYVALTVFSAAVALGLGVLSDPLHWVRSTPLAPLLGAQAIERPQDGYGLRMPSDWEYVIAVEADPAEWWDADEVDDVEAYHQDFLAEGGLLMARRVSLLGVKENCTVTDESALAATPPRWTKLKDWERSVRQAWQGDPAIIDLQTDYMDLPAGRVLCLDVLGTDGWDARDYVYKQGPDWFSLRCGATIAPDDRWLSIAESFELLPRTTE